MRLRQTYLGCTATAGSKATRSLRNQTFNHSIDIAASGSACGEKNLEQGLFSKTGNDLGAKSGRLRRSGMVWGLTGSCSGTNLVQIEFVERAVAQGCVGSLFASAIEFGRSAGNSVLAAA